MTQQRFSRRTGWDLAETEWARRLRERREAGLPIIDLTASNPTQCGFEYDSEAILAALRDPACLAYDPDPRGIASARAAVAGYYAAHGASADPDRTFLTTGTSEAYSFLFRLLCDPGDEALIAQPSYPLFDFLADLHDVRLIAYPLFYDYGWHLDPEALRRKITPRTRAIVVVHPNNPTGHFTKNAERAILEEVCVEYGLALIVDEVFLDYPLNPAEAARSFASGEHPVLTFALSGLSKVAALPQMKVAWIACFGPKRELAAALERLEAIADTFLSMNAPVQQALPHWMAGRARIQAQILTRVQANLEALDKSLDRQTLIGRLKVEAGWYAALRVPAIGNDRATALKLLEQEEISIHTGGFFGFAEAGWLIVSLLGECEDFLIGMNRLTAFFQRIGER